MSHGPQRTVHSISCMELGGNDQSTPSLVLSLHSQTNPTDQTLVLSPHGNGHMHRAGEVPKARLRARSLKGFKNHHNQWIQYDTMRVPKTACNEDFTSFPNKDLHLVTKTPHDKHTTPSRNCLLELPPWSDRKLAQEV